MAILYDELGNAWLGALDQITGGTYTDARAPSANLALLNAEAIADLNGHCVAMFDIRGVFVGTVVFEGTVDGTNYVSIPVINQATQAFITAPTTVGVFIGSVTGFRRVRVRVSAYTSGTVVATIRASMADYAITAIPYPATTAATNTGLAGAAVTLTVAAGGVGLFHYFTRIQVQRIATALMTAAATPVLVTTTNLPGTRVLSIPADAAAQGTIYTELISPSQPLKSTAANTATTIVCPATPNAIWRVTADYYLGA
jgi:hypothetical protein